MWNEYLEHNTEKINHFLSQRYVNWLSIFNIAAQGFHKELICFDTEELDLDDLDESQVTGLFDFLVMLDRPELDSILLHLLHLGKAFRFFPWTEYVSIRIARLLIDQDMVGATNALGWTVGHLYIGTMTKKRMELLQCLVLSGLPLFALDKRNKTMFEYIAEMNHDCARFLKWLFDVFPLQHKELAEAMGFQTLSSHLITLPLACEFMKKGLWKHIEDPFGFLENTFDTIDACDTIDAVDDPLTPSLCSQLLQMMLNAGHDPNSADADNGDIALHRCRVPHCTKLLLDHGADPSVKNHRGEIALIRQLAPDFIHDSFNEDGDPSLLLLDPPFRGTTTGYLILVSDLRNVSEDCIRDKISKQEWDKQADRVSVWQMSRASACLEIACQVVQPSYWPRELHDLVLYFSNVKRPNPF